MLQLKSFIEASVENILSFLNNDSLANDDNNEKYLLSLENSPKKIKNKYVVLPLNYTRSVNISTKEIGLLSLNKFLL